MTKRAKGKDTPHAGMPRDQRAVLTKLMTLASAAGIRAKRKSRKPRGKPFKKGGPRPEGKPFKPGESGHPEGRPPATPEEQDFDTIVKAAAPRLARLAIAQLEGTAGGLGPDGIIGELTTPKVRMFENLWALAGRPIPRKVELGGIGGGPIEIEEVGPGRALLAKLAGEDLGDDEGEDGDGDGGASGSPAPEAPPPSDRGAGEP
jgi:hypothetical protein